MKLLQNRVVGISNHQIHQKDNFWHVENEISGGILPDRPPPQIHDIILAVVFHIGKAQRDGS